MDKAVFKKELVDNMTKTISNFEHDISGIRSGRATNKFLDPIRVSVYGNTQIPLTQVSTISVVDSRTILIQVWDKNLIKIIEKSIIESQLGVIPILDGTNIKLVLPMLTAERRKELVKLLYKYGEQAKISLRNIRREKNDFLKKLEKTSEITKDEFYKMIQEIQKLTDDFITKVDNKIKIKENDIINI